jgi:hypothetical protein
MTNYYQLREGTAPWGDYGSILRNGWAETIEDGGREEILVTRTGPFVPPISFPLGHIVVTDGFRAEISQAPFSGLSFEPVRYGAVIRLDWESWDPRAPEPAYYPDSGEPEDYLLEGDQDAGLSGSMPRLWRWNVASTAGLQAQGSNTFRRVLHPGLDVAREFQIHWISERMKVWLSEHAGQWVNFVPVTPQ